MVGETNFPLPPFRDAPDRDARYLSHLRQQHLPDRDVAKAFTMRALVPAFLERAADEILATGL